MTPFEFLWDRWQRNAAHYPYWRRPTPPETPAKAGEHYFRLTLTEMFLTDERKWFSQWQPVTYVAVRFRFGDKDEIVNHIAGASALKDVDASHLNQGVALNYSITPLVPYNGGEIEIEAGLVAVQGDNDVKRLLKVLGDFSRVLAVPQLSTALSFAGPLADGAAELLGVAGNRPVLHLHDTFNAEGNPLAAMHMIVLSDPGETLDKAKASIVEGRLRYDGKPLTDYDYMVFRIDTPAERYDWESLSSIEDPYLSAIEALQTALLEPDPDRAKTQMLEADRRLGAAKLAAYRAKELTKIVGRNQVLKALQSRYAEAKQSLGAAGAAAQDDVPRTLKEVMATRISVEDARRLGETSEQDLLVESE